MHETLATAPVSCRTRQIPAPYYVVFEACLAHLTASGWMIELAQKESGIITTDYWTNSGLSAVFAGHERVKYSLYLAPVGEDSTRIVATKSRQNSNLGGWSESNVLTADAAEEYKRTLDAIESLSIAMTPPRP